MLLPDRPFGRQVRSVAGYALLTAMMIVTPMLVFVPAALLHCAIRNGRRAAWVAMFGAIALASLYAGIVPYETADEQKLAWSFLAGVALAIALPAMAAVPMVERGEKFGRVVMLLMAGALVGLALTEIACQTFLSFSPYAAQLAQAKETGVRLVEMYRSNGFPSDMVQAARRWTDFTLYVLPGQMLILISLVFILSLLMLGRLKAWRELAARLGDTEAPGAYLFRNFALPDWLLFAFILGGLTPLVSGLLQKVAANTLAVVAFLYVVQGLAIFRFMLAAMGAGVVGTMLGWLLLVFLTITGIGPLLLGVAGLFDPFFDFRHFKKRKDDSHESHSD